MRLLQISSADFWLGLLVVTRAQPKRSKAIVRKCGSKSSAKRLNFFTPRRTVVVDAVREEYSLVHILLGSKTCTGQPPFP